MIRIQVPSNDPVSRRDFLKTAMISGFGLGTLTTGTSCTSEYHAPLTSYSSNKTINSTYRWFMDKEADLAKKIFPDLPFPLESWFNYYRVGLDNRYSGGQPLDRVQSEIQAEAPEVEIAEKKKLLDLDPITDILPIFDRTHFSKYYAEAINYRKGKINSLVSFLKDEGDSFRFNKLFKDATEPERFKSRRFKKAEFFDDDELMRLWTYIRIRSEHNTATNKSSPIESSHLDKESLRTRMLVFLCPNMTLEDIRKTINEYDNQQLQELKKMAERDEIRARYAKSSDAKSPDAESPDSKSPDSKPPDSKSPDSKSPNSKSLIENHRPLIRGHRIRSPRIMSHSKD